MPIKWAIDRATITSVTARAQSTALGVTMHHRSRGPSLSPSILTTHLARDSSVDPVYMEIRSGICRNRRILLTVN